MNVYDSRVVAEILQQEGYQEVDNENEANVIIVNTCSVREHAERRALGRISSLLGLRIRNPDLIIGVIGCMAQNLGNKIKGVDFILGPSNYKELPRIINTRFKNQDLRQICVEESLELYSDILPNPNDRSKDLSLHHKGRKVTASVPVMRGCSNFCSYCIVPYVRGRARSRSYQDILKEIEFLKSKGIKDITLLGQSANEYDDGELNFAGLLRAINEIGIPRIRFTTSHPKNMSDELIEIMRDGANICEWLHLPLQSGATKILNRMNRRYTKEDYLNWIYKIRQAIPGVAITTDVMVGFPGETEADFKETMQVVKEVKFDFAYMFKYSDREKTKASKMNDKISEEVQQKRLTELINTQNKITLKKSQQLVGKVVEILIEGTSRRSNSLYGRTRNNKVVIFDGKAKLGELVKVKVEGLRGWTPYGS